MNEGTKQVSSEQEIQEAYEEIKEITEDKLMFEGMTVEELEKVDALIKDLRAGVKRQ